MAESLLLAVVTRVTGKAADVLVQSVTRMWGVDADRHKLQRRLLTMQCMLADAEVKEETNPAVRRWMKELKAVAYLADDILDNIQYEGLRLEAQDGAACKIQRYFTLHSPFLFRLTVNRNLNRILKKFDELILETRMLGLVERMEVPQPLHQQVYSTLDESAEIFVRVHEKEMVVKLLLDQEDNKKVQVLPIIGMAGLGKTTLARMVYNDCRVQKHFELKMWHCVSENFRPTAILRSIIELATMEPCDLPDTIEMLRRRLQGVIGRKRFLLILDDVWNEEQQKWEAYLRPDCLALVEQLDIFACHNIVHWPIDELGCLPRLRSLHIWLCNKLERKGSSSEEILPLPQLECLSVQNCDSLLEIPNLPASLEELKISCSRSLVALPSNLGSLAKLRRLSVEDCDTLKTLPDGMDGLTSLEGLIVEECPGIEKLPQGLLQRLPALQLLEIKACPDLQKHCSHGGEYFDLISCIPDKDIPALESKMKKFVTRLHPSC
ncbi:hypothetical protein QOZ80_8AG0639370 [Eleusine coracana subsp. coracana]|nr:hypothetical protein QOZ80_8AG0639370 [Eleusine coracana subsp. coracana]